MNQQPPSAATNTSEANPYDAYFEFSAITSDILRKLTLAGIALVWIFSGGKGTEVQEIQVQGKYVIPLGLLLLAAAFDLFQYVYLTLAHRIVGALVESGRRTEPGVPKWLPRVAEFGFYLPKLVLACVGWTWLLVRLAQQVT